MRWSRMMPKKLEEENKLREALIDMVDQFAYPLDDPPRITTGGLSVLEEAFEVLGYPDPMETPEKKCQFDGCNKRATCGTPTEHGYKRVCIHHFKFYVRKGGDKK